MVTTVLGGNGRITIPAAIRKAAGLRQGDALDVEITDEGVLFRPSKRSAEQGAAMQPSVERARINEALERIGAGERWVFQSGDEFLAVLEAFPPADADV